MEADADHVGCVDTCNSTSGGIQFQGDKLVSWMSKKQGCTAMSSTEAEYVALSASCAQVMWTKVQLKDCGFNYNKILLYCDSQTDYQLADMFTKALPKDRFQYLVRQIDADHVGCVDTCKSTSGGIQFQGDKLVSWMSKKQGCTAMSSTEAEYVALSASCAQVMWTKVQLKDCGFNYNKILLYCDSQSAIAISCNPVQHSRTKHIHTRYHFI
nr:Gag-Pol polyprotein [Tanacetum cinerariifolium]